MKMQNTYKITFAITALAFLSCSHFAQAGSKEPNPAALAKAAKASSEASRIVESDVQLLLSRLAKGDDFTKKFDQATYKKDVKGLNRLIKESGIKKSTMTVVGVESDLRITIKVCWGRWCVTFGIEW